MTRWRMWGSLWRDICREDYCRNSVEEGYFESLFAIPRDCLQPELGRCQWNSDGRRPIRPLNCRPGGTNNHSRPQYRSILQPSCEDLAHLLIMRISGDPYTGGTEEPSGLPAKGPLALWMDGVTELLTASQEEDFVSLIMASFRVQRIYIIIEALPLSLFFVHPFVLSFILSIYQTEVGRCLLWNAVSRATAKLKGAGVGIFFSFLLERHHIPLKSKQSK